MKFLFFGIIGLTLSGCVGTRLYQDGKPIIAMYGNYSQVRYRNGSITFEATGVDHSTIIRETGNTIQKGFVGGAAGFVPLAL